MIKICIFKLKIYSKCYHQKKTRVFLTMSKLILKNVYKQLSSSRLICAKIKWFKNYLKEKSSLIILNVLFVTKFLCFQSKNVKTAKKCFVEHVYTNYKRLKRNLIVPIAKNHVNWEFWTGDIWKLLTRNLDLPMFAMSLCLKSNIG